MENNSKSLYAFLGIAVIGVGAIILFKDKNSSQEQQNVDQTHSEQTPFLAQQSNLPNGNKLLKIGVNGYETLQLQSLLGMMQNGVFSSQTETALLKKKGVKEITLNQWKTIPNLI